MKISKWIYTAALGLLFASCQSVETPMFSDEKDAFIAFDEQKISFAENSVGEVKIPVFLVASKGYNVTVNFTIDASAYEEDGTAAKEDVHFRVKNETNILNFVEGGEHTQYIVLETIDNDDFGGDVFFDIQLELVEGDVNYGAYYTTTVTLQDDDHPLKKLGILGSYNCTATSPFDGSALSWTCNMTSDPKNVNVVWISQLGLPASGVPEFTYAPIYGVWSNETNSITIEAGQEAGSVQSYTLRVNFMDFEMNPFTSVTMARSGSDFSISSSVVVYEADGIGLVGGAYNIMMTKVAE